MERKAASLLNQQMLQAIDIIAKDEDTLLQNGRGRLLGCGAYGSVYEGYAEGGFFFAVKEVQSLNQGNQAKQCLYQIEQEITLFSHFDHRNIVQYYGTDKDESKLYIFLELVSNGSLAEIYTRYELKDTQVSAYTKQILEGLKYLPKHQIIHRDIKCANMLVNAGGTVKLSRIYFGLAKVTEVSNLIKSCNGTPSWMAPEVVNLKRRGGYGLPADIWSLRCTVLEILTRKRPYLEPGQVLCRIGKGETPSIPDSLSDLSQNFILQCLQVNSDDRSTAAKLLDHPFVKS